MITKNGEIIIFEECIDDFGYKLYIRYGKGKYLAIKLSDLEMKTLQSELNRKLIYGRT